MKYSAISFLQEEKHAEITLSRPEVFNSVNQTLAQELIEALTYCKTNSSIRAILLTGNGKGFCAGQDLAEVKEEMNETPRLEKFVQERFNPIVKLIRETPKPIVCAVNGAAAGAGANVALACDIVLASEKASFIQSFSNVGLIPDGGGTFTLPRLVGLARATALIMLGEKVTATDAVNMGMIYQCIPHEELLVKSRELVVHLASRPTKGLGLSKQALNASSENSLAEQLQLECQLQQKAGETADFKEGMCAFLEKRAPVFEGK